MRLTVCQAAQLQIPLGDQMLESPEDKINKAPSEDTGGQKDFLWDPQ